MSATGQRLVPPRKTWRCRHCERVVYVREDLEPRSEHHRSGRCAARDALPKTARQRRLLLEAAAFWSCYLGCTVEAYLRFRAGWRAPPPSEEALKAATALWKAATAHQ